VAVLPLSRNERLVPEARRVCDLVKPEWMCQYDDAGAIGRRYRRQDEVGTPFCVTIDFESLDDRQVTVRERDSMSQDRLPIGSLVTYLRDRL
jgi:glycyl-tRNA synthetase